MKGLSVAQAGAPYVVVDDLQKPTPGANQILLKSVATAMNPVDGYMQGMGLLITKFPIILGCDAGGVVVEVGKNVSSFKPGDKVCGCTRLGIPGYGTFQEYYLMDADLTIPVPESMPIEQACTLGVGTMTASLGLFYGLKVELPKGGETVAPNGKWIVVLGGAGSVGQYAIQLAKLSGYKVVTSCSPSSKALVEAAGAEAMLNYKDSEEKQLEDLKAITGGQFAGVFDTAAQNFPISMKMLETVAALTPKRFSTTDDWSPLEGPEDILIDRIKLGEIGRSLDGGSGPPEIDEAIASYVPVLAKLISSGLLKPNEHEVIGQPGLEGVLKGCEMQAKGARGGKKYVVHVTE